MRVTPTILLAGLCSAFAYSSNAQVVVLSCESIFDNSYSSIEIGSEPIFERENYIATITLDLVTQSLLELSGDISFDAINRNINCDSPTWDVTETPNEIKISTAYFQCGQMLSSDLDWEMNINRITGEFYRFFGDLSGTFGFSQGVCNAARQLF